MIEARSGDTGPPGSVRERAMVYAYGEEKNYELNVLRVAQQIVMRPYKENHNDLSNAWGVLYNFLDKKRTTITKEEVKENLVKTETSIKNIMAERKKAWQDKKNLTGG